MPLAAAIAAGLAALAGIAAFLLAPGADAGEPAAAERGTEAPKQG
ncbi:MAG TPA: hypothetical protein VIG76_02510 [Amnibacterium sp.]|jgi:hypothetical protein